MTSKPQNRPIPIPQPALLLLIVVFLFLGGHVSAGAPFLENFDSYYIGNLAGQGGWATTSDFYAQTTTTDSFSSPNSAYWTSEEYQSIKKTGTEVASGQWSFWLLVNTDSTSGSDNEWGIIYLTSDVGMVSYLRIECYNENCSLTSETARIQYQVGGIKAPLCDIPTDEWVNLQVGWNNADNTTRWKCGDEPWTEWVVRAGFDFISTFELKGSNETGKIEINLDNITTTPYGGFSAIEITSPTTGSEKEESFDLEGSFNLGGEDWDRIMVIFEQWHASSTCPEYQSEDWETEYSNGWFITQSMPFFSDFISTSTGNFSILVDDLRTGIYNCTRCYFINETEGTISSEKCPAYNLIIADITPTTAEFYYPFLSWQSYYATSSEEFATSTPLFENIANALTPIVNKMGGFILYAKDYFDSTEAMAKGNELGQAIPKARGYLEMIDDFIGLPLSSFVIFYFLTMAVVISYKVILTIIKLLKP